MQLKSYRAWTMNDALAAVKRDLGADAVILNTRSFRRGGILHLGRKTVIEVTAARAADMENSREVGVVGGAMPIAARRAYAGATGSPTMSLRDSNGKPSAPTHGEFERQRTRLLAQALAATHARQPIVADGAPPNSPASSSNARNGMANRASTAMQSMVPTSTPAQTPTDSMECRVDAVARRFILTPAGTDPAVATGGWAANARSATTADGILTTPINRGLDAAVRSQSRGDRPARHPVHRLAVDDRFNASMREELAEIRGLVGRVLQGQAGDPGASRPPGALFDMYLKLISQDVSAELADRIVAKVRDELGPEMIDDVEAVRNAMCDELCRLIPSMGDQPAPTRVADRPHVLALIGPTGVGKTTTVAKLAATFKLKHQRSVGMITCDTYRIAAVDQLRTYADIIGVPLEVALSPPDMQRAVKALGRCDMVLIDTAGRGQNDARRLDELRDFIDAAAPDEVHLVLSSTAGEKVLLREAEAFAAIRADRIVLTKLDEAVGMGMVVNAMHRVGKSLSFVTTGQEVPEHIEPGGTRRLAAMLLGDRADSLAIHG